MDAQPTSEAHPSQARSAPLAIATWIILGLLTLLYGPLLYHWLHGWLFKSISIEHEYYSHGVLGIPLAAYGVWMHRSRWSALGDRHNPWGAAVMGLAAVCYGSGLADLVNLSLFLLLSGMALWLKGWDGLRLQSFPLLFLFLAIPTDLPYLITANILPLQQLIASLIGLIMTMLGYEVGVEGIYVFVGDRTIEVAPYCAGLKLLFTNVYVTLMLLYWTGLWRSHSRSWALLGSTIGLSFFANVIRNTVLAAFHGGGSDAAFHWLHDGWGGDLFSLAMMGVIFGLLTALEHYWPLPCASISPDSVREG